jgi:CheY-like chemotaxis protein
LIREWRERTHPDDYQRVIEARDSCLEGRAPIFEVEFRLRHKDGGYRWVACRGACVRDAEGRPYRMAGSLTDITERKKLEQQLLQSQKMESVAILAGGVAHEFNDLLTAISGYGQMLRESIPQDDETFTIYLPLFEGYACEEKPKTPAPYVVGMKTVLVAEDEAIVRCFLKRMLERSGYKVIVAEDGEEAVARFREHDDISLVLSDVVMPGKNGKEVLDEIRKLKPGIKVLFISGYAADVIHDFGMFDEGTDLIQKPFNKNLLSRKVRKILDA